MVDDGEEIRVLCIDDDPALGEVLAEMLERVEDRIVAEPMQDPTAALDRLCSTTQYECVVCDYEMPQMDGLEVLEAVRDRDQEIPFLLYTGKGSEEIASEAISAGVTDYLQKDAGTEHYELLANRILEYAGKYRTSREYELTEQRFRRLVEQSVAGIALSQDEVFRYANPRFAEIFGYDRDEIIGMSVLDVIDESDHDRVREAIRRRESGRVETVHYIVTARDREGNRFDLEVNGSRVTHEGDPAVLGVVQPLDTRRKALARTDTDAVAELRTQLECARESLEAADADDSHLPAARRSVEAALARLGADPIDDEASGDTVDLGERCRTALERTDLTNAALTVESSPEVTAAPATVDQLLAELLAPWEDTDRPIAVSLRETPDGCEIAIDPAASDDQRVEPPPHPAALSRISELLGWDVYISESSGSIVYSFEDATGE